MIAPLDLLAVEDQRGESAIGVLRHYQLFHEDQVRRGGAGPVLQGTGQAGTTEMREGIGPAAHVGAIGLLCARTGGRVHLQGDAVASQRLVRGARAILRRVADGEDVHAAEARQRAHQGPRAVVPAVTDRPRHVGRKEVDPHR